MPVRHVGGIAKVAATVFPTAVSTAGAVTASYASSDFSDQATRLLDVAELEDTAAAAASSSAVDAALPEDDLVTDPAFPVFPPIPEGVTTLIVRNLPARLSAEQLARYWPACFGYNYLHIPYAKGQGRHCLYCFINFESRQALLSFYYSWHGRALGPGRFSRILEIGVARIQGLEANLHHWSNTGKRTNANIKARHFPIIIGEDGHELNFLETVDFSTEQARLNVEQEENQAEEAALSDAMPEGFTAEAIDTAEALRLQAALLADAAHQDEAAEQEATVHLAEARPR